MHDHSIRGIGIFFVAICTNEKKNRCQSAQLDSVVVFFLTRAFEHKLKSVPTPPLLLGHHFPYSQPPINHTEHLHIEKYSRYV
jgi:hypothetical protein